MSARSLRYFHRQCAVRLCVCLWVGAVRNAHQGFGELSSVHSGEFVFRDFDVYYQAYGRLESGSAGVCTGRGEFVFGGFFTSSRNQKS